MGSVTITRTSLALWNGTIYSMCVASETALIYVCDVDFCLTWPRVSLCLDHLEGDVTPNSQARQYEYHAQQLDRFLQEYRNLQEQLYKMKESCEGMQKKNSSSSKGSR